MQLPSFYRPGSVFRPKPLILILVLPSERQPASDRACGRLRARAYRCMFDLPSLKSVRRSEGRIRYH
eukprot:275890-Amorphochlora_amoeboformis.AAC.1